MGCQKYTARQALADAAETWREVRQDDIAHGQPDERPFFNYFAIDGACVFTIYGRETAIYVLPGDESAFRSRFDKLAMKEVEEAMGILAEDFHKSLPDLLLNEQLTRKWLEK
jgi:hypothetical protein